MSLNSVAQEKIVVPAGTKADLSFLDCPVEDLQLTATQTYGNWERINAAHMCSGLSHEHNLDMEKMLCLVWL